MNKKSVKFTNNRFLRLSFTSQDSAMVGRSKPKLPTKLQISTESQNMSFRLSALYCQPFGYYVQYYFAIFIFRKIPLCENSFANVLLCGVKKQVLPSINSFVIGFKLTCSTIIF